MLIDPGGQRVQPWCSSRPRLEIAMLSVGQGLTLLRVVS
jgi:hypothetical protein